VTAPARLLGLRLQGFKSFAERTVVEFDAGISAVVGPNGSGKSNLADALRWALGEQGRSLRTRKSEDVIFAGSERRAALGMADVTLILDNADGLLPVDYSVLELGRRLYRSGENDYLLNRQRVRLRDLVDLLDAAHLADNAFLFIGQGMVDQALALRPEERRPLFEEVAGVRRHERRRRRAEEQLVEAEANLARVQDIVAELRPQARRLAAQAEQQTTRRSAGEELVAALVLSAHARWHDASARVADAAARLARERAEVDSTMAVLQAAEAAVAAVSGELGTRAGLESDLRGTHDRARSALAGLQLREARLTADLESTARDRARLETERATALADIDLQRRSLAEPAPLRDIEADAALAEAERALADALAELAGLRTERAARGEQLAALRRAENARTAELETARRRAADASARAAAERAEAQASTARLGDEEMRLATAQARLATAVAAERTAIEARDAARTEVDRAEGERQAGAERATAASARLAELGGRLDALRARLAEDESRPIARAARRVGGRRLDEDLGVEPAFRAAVELALGDAARGYLVGRATVEGLAGERGTLVVDGASAGAAGAPDRTAIAAATMLGGGRLGDAIRRDPSGMIGQLLERACWVPDIAALVVLQPDLPPGWLAVVRDGSASAGPLAISLGRADDTLERRAEAERIAVDLADATAAAAEVDRIAASTSDRASAARSTFDAARDAEGVANGTRRRAEEDERAAGRALESIAREAGWHAAQTERLGAEAERAAAAVAGLAMPADTAGDGHAEAHDDADALAAWDARAHELRARRDRLAIESSVRDGERRAADARRARAEASATLDEERIGRIGTDLAQLVDRERSVRDEIAGVGVELAVEADREQVARVALDELRASDALDRGRLAEGERSSGVARDRLRAADERARRAEVVDLEARLALDAVREALLVELAGLGELGLRALAADGAPVDDRSAAGVTGSAADAADTPSRANAVDALDDETEALDEGEPLAGSLAALTPHWAETTPAEVPSAGRLANLRRRYHELGAANPYAVEEYAEVRTRLDGLELQERDLRAAIVDTRRLIDELATMIAEQFRTTFQALESAFDARFRQLFGGGFARLSLTDPADLAATGIEIVARPPGKKAQALAMLSGGERALTAVALLFAMLEVRPVPFCVLDEVDAALDEANVGRFAEALRSLADRTQFIVITHNRGTIEAADALYGVTVGDDSVSRVISLRLDEATALAETARTAPADVLA
jgi:chromosome segregation protein